MRNTFGNALTITLFGESHGSAIGAVLDGLAPGIEIDDAFIKNRLFQRKPKAGTGTARRESDDYRFQSGVYNGKTYYRKFYHRPQLQQCGNSRLF